MLKPAKIYVHFRLIHLYLRRKKGPRFSFEVGRGRTTYSEETGSLSIYVGMIDMGWLGFLC